MTLFLQLLLGALVSGIIYALMAVGFNLVYRRTFSGDFLYGISAIIALYLLYFFEKQFSVDGMLLLPAILFVVVILGIVGLLVDRYVYLPLEKRVGSGMSVFMLSFGIYFFIQWLISFLFGDQFKIYSFSLRSLDLPQFIRTEQLLVLLVGIGCLFIYFILFENRQKAEKYNVFFGFMLAAVAGILYGIDMGFRPSTGLTLLLNGVAASIVAGPGKVRAGIFVAFLISIAEGFGTWQFDTNNKNMILFWFLILSSFFVYRKTISQFLLFKTRKL
ncbi:MAG: branched-chain amino acid ABC transporter permease [bacterium]|nr:branched-chain amino acid ABC transporter permease [bacterium]